MASLRWINDEPGRNHLVLRLAALAAAAGALVALVGCGGSDGAAAPDTTDRGAATTTVAGVTPTAVDVTTVTTGAAASTTLAPTTTAAATTTAAPTTVPPTTAPPDVLQRQPGVTAIEVSAGGADPTRPTFTWAAVEGATSYELVVHADGSPLWAWTGVDTSVPLGGVERATDQEGPTLTGPATVRVYAFDASTHLLAISPWTPTPAFT